MCWISILLSTWTIIMSGEVNIPNVVDDVRTDQNFRRMASSIEGQFATVQEALDTIQAQLTAALASYIRHDLSTAASDFLVGSGSNTFIKKTLAEARVVLGIPMLSKSQAFTSNGNFTVPAGITCIYVTLIGGAGGGGTGSSVNGGGGGGASEFYYRRQLKINQQMYMLLP
jgi:hypothetical protein